MERQMNTDVVIHCYLAASQFHGPVDVVGTLHAGVQAAEGHVQSVYRIDVEKVARDSW
jgi:hypothetical protein